MGFLAIIEEQKRKFVTTVLVLLYFFLLFLTKQEIRKTFLWKTEAEELKKRKIILNINCGVKILWNVPQKSSNTTNDLNDDHLFSAHDDTHPTYTHTQRHKHTRSLDRFDLFLKKIFICGTLDTRIQLTTTDRTVKYWLSAQNLSDARYVN